jgi:hypothetical protein
LDRTIISLNYCCSNGTNTTDNVINVINFFLMDGIAWGGGGSFAAAPAQKTRAANLEAKLKL